MFKCKCCEILKNENAHLRSLVEQLLLQIAPKSDNTGEGAFPVKEQEYIGEDGLKQEEFGL